MEKNEFRFNISSTEHLPTGPDLHVAIVVGFILIMLLLLVAILLFRYVPRLANNWRERRAEAALARAIDIYNSQKPVDEPDLVCFRPGDQTEYRSADDLRRKSEIAFVHSDGHIERFRPHVNASNSRRESSTSGTKHIHKPQTRLHSGDPQYCNVTTDEAYAAFQPLCVTLESIAAQRLDADHGETVSVEGCDMPPAYEEALEMPAAMVVGALDKNDRGMAVGRKLDVDYYNIDTGKQSRTRQSKDTVVSECETALLPFKAADGHL